MPPMASIAEAEQLHQAVEATKENGLVIACDNLKCLVGLRKGFPLRDQKGDKEECYHTGSGDVKREKIGGARVFLEILSFSQAVPVTWKRKIQII